MSNGRHLRRSLARVLLTALIPLVGMAQTAAQSVATQENLAYRTGSDLSDYARERGVLDLYLPEGGERFPLLVWFHGGGLTAGDKASQGQPDIARALADRGIAVAVANYRLSPAATYPAYVDDAAASVAWVLEHVADYGGDPERVFVAGHSAGGYLAAMVGLDPVYLAAYGRSPAELAGLIPVSGQMITHATVREERGLSADVPLVDAAAPVHHVRGDAPPWLAIAGAADLPARAEENRYFIAALKAVEHPDASYLEFEGRDHGTIVSRIPEPDDPVAAAIGSFIQRH